jgi:hypothetical protein
MGNREALPTGCPPIAGGLFATLLSPPYRVPEFGGYSPSGVQPPKVARDTANTLSEFDDLPTHWRQQRQQKVLRGQIIEL